MCDQIPRYRDDTVGLTMVYTTISLINNLNSNLDIMAKWVKAKNNNRLVCSETYIPLPDNEHLREYLDLLLNIISKYSPALQAWE